MSQDKVIAYLQRLTGTPIDAATARLTSAQKAALAAWMRREEIGFSTVILQRPAFSIAALLGTEAEGGTPQPVRTVHPAPQGARALLSRVKVGIDLESVKTLPDAMDYREHEFYRDNFTAEEIAYCLQRPDAKTSLCGLWAAKEAILKAVGGARPQGGMRAIEIYHDSEGRPRHDGGELSISHSGDFCVAVFVSLT